MEKKNELDKKDHKEQLWKMFANVNDWLKFAEVKNQILLVAIMATPGVFSHFLPKTDLLPFRSYPLWLNIFSGLILLSYCISFFISFSSFFPKNKRDYNKENRKQSSYEANPNLLFFQHISIYNSSDFYKLLAAKYKIESPDGMEKDLIDQIHINAEIAEIKYRRFNLSFIVYVFAVFLSIVCIFVWGYLR